MNRFGEILKEHGVKHYTELPENMRKVLEQAYPDECRYGVELAAEFKQAEELARIKKSNEEHERKEHERRQRQREQEIKDACDTAFQVSMDMRTALTELCLKFRKELFSCAELDYEVNNNIIKAIIKQHTDNNYSRKVTDKIIHDAYACYEFKHDYKPSK